MMDTVYDDVENEARAAWYRERADVDIDFDPSEDYRPRPMSIQRYHAWCAEQGITPNPDYGIYSDTPPF